MKSHYNQTFYQSRNDKTIYSAKAIISIVNELVSPSSVLDVGCGVGTWLQIFQELGAEQLLGIEGHWVQDENIVIPKEYFTKTDISKPIDLKRSFDLVVSMEVAEHIDENHADQFVRNLVLHAPVILFSAAIPKQGGTHHVNEQWPEYWKEKFDKHNYVIIDCIRKRIWNDNNVIEWYAQNTFFYVNKSLIQNYPLLQNEYVENPGMLSIVHPRLFHHKMEYYSIQLAIRNKFKRGLKKILK